MLDVGNTAIHRKKTVLFRFFFPYLTTDSSFYVIGDGGFKLVFIN